VLERKEGKDIDLFKIPVPKWHEHDGGYYTGTAATGDYERP
jgi:UbiD family decarboxylase